MHDHSCPCTRRWHQLTSDSPGDKKNTWRQLAEELQDSAVALDEVRAALQQPEFDFNLNYLQALRSHTALTTVRGATTIYISHAAVHYTSGSLISLQRSQAQLALCRTLENEPVMLSQMVRSPI